MRSWPASILSFALIVAPPSIIAQQKPNSTPPKYNLTTETTLKGTVEQVSNHECPVSRGMGAHVILKTDDGKTIEVHLAPTKFVKIFDLVLAKGDQIAVTGSKVEMDGVDTIFAREMKRGNDTFTFRDDKGKPVW